MIRSFAVVLAMLIAFPAAAAEVEAGIRYIALFSNGDSQFEGGSLEIEQGRGFGAAAQIFWNDSVSLQVAGLYANPVVFLRTASAPSPIDMDTLELDLYTATARWHFAPPRRLHGFIGGGAALVVADDLDDRFGENIEIELESGATYAIEAGVRYRLRPRIIIDVAAVYTPFEAESVIRRADDPNIPLPPRVDIDPLVISVGASWRFGR